MINSTFLFVNTTLVVGCMVMAFIFLILPLPENKGLHKYRTSLRFLAGAYLIMALLQFLFMAFNVAKVNMISIEELTLASIQAPLFTFALITLINPQLISKIFLTRRLLTIFILLFFYFSFKFKWGDPIILNLVELKLLAFHPTVIIRELFALYYVYQIVYLTNLFRKQVHLYEDEIDNFFADNQSLHVSWIKYSFYACFSVGVCTFLSFFLFSSLCVLIFTVVYAIFYLVYALFYIQYPRTFIYIEQAIFTSGESTRELSKNSKRLVWDELRNQIIVNKYYLKSGVTIEEMAQYLKIGRTTLSNFINNEEGMNFNMWVNSLRVEEAKWILINNPTYSLIQIAEMTGYSESSNFSRQFKLITNESPSVWRQSCQS